MRSLLLLLVLLLPLAASAQNRFAASFFAGYSQITEPDDAREAWGDGYNFGLRGGYVLNPNLEVTVGLTLNSFAFDEDAYRRIIFRQNPEATRVTELGGGNIAVASVMVGVRGRLNLPYVSPYGMVGLGYFRYTRNQVVGVINDSQGFAFGRFEQSTFGGEIGAGVDVPVTDALGLFVEGRYIIGLLEQQVSDGGDGTRLEDLTANAIPLSIGFRLQLGT